jgi:hypothetical protein
LVQTFEDFQPLKGYTAVTDRRVTTAAPLQPRAADRGKSVMVIAHPTGVGTPV